MSRRTVITVSDLTRILQVSGNTTADPWHVAVLSARDEAYQAAQDDNYLGSLDGRLRVGTLCGRRPCDVPEMDGSPQDTWGVAMVYPLGGADTVCAECLPGYGRQVPLKRLVPRPRA